MQRNVVDVILVGFTGGTSGQAQLAGLERVLGIDRTAAKKLVLRTPTPVRTSVAPADANRLAFELRAIGAWVELRAAPDVGDADFSDLELPPRKARASSNAPPAAPSEPGLEAAFFPSPPPVPSAISTPPLPTSLPAPPSPPSSPSPSPPPPARSREPSSGARSLDLAADTAPPLDLEDVPRTSRRSSRPPAAHARISSYPPAPARVSSYPPPAARVSSRPPVTGDDVAEDEASFWSSIPGCFAVPLRGSGLKWMAWIAGYALVLRGAWAVTRPVPVIGILVGAFVSVGLLSLVGGFFRATLLATSAGESEPERMPELDASRLWGDYVVPGLSVTLFSVSSQIPVLAWVVVEMRAGHSPAWIAAHPVTWALLSSPILYWPVGLSLLALTGSFASIWNAIRAARIVLSALLEYATVLFAGLSMLVVPSVLLVLVASRVTPWVAVAFAPIMFGLPLAYCHGLQGALMGSLFRARPELAD